MNKDSCLYISILSIVSLLIISGCASKEPRNLSLLENNLPHHIKNFDSLCKLKVKNVLDERVARENYGKLINSSINVNDAKEWVRTSLETLVVKEHEHFEEISIKASIKKFYMYSVHSQMVANIVLKVDYYKSENLMLSKIHRGTETQSNVFGADSEIASSFENALEKIVNQIDVESKNICEKSN